jgi:hypothetical protein
MSRDRNAPGKRPTPGLILGDRVVPQPPHQPLNRPHELSEPSIGLLPSLTSAGQRNTRSLAVWLVDVHVGCVSLFLIFGSERPAAGNRPIPPGPADIAARTSRRASGTNPPQFAGSRGVRASEPAQRDASSPPPRITRRGTIFVRPRVTPPPPPRTHTPRGRIPIQPHQRAQPTHTRRADRPGARKSPAPGAMCHTIQVRAPALTVLRPTRANAQQTHRRSLWQSSKISLGLLEALAASCAVQ